MEKNKNGCVLLKQKEYDDLITKSKENQSKVIRVQWYYSTLNISGDFTLSDGLYQQISKIFSEIDLKNKEDQNQVMELTRSYMKVKFSELPWYKRLFFKEERIK